MSAPQFTPGPWKADDGDGGDGGDWGVFQEADSDGIAYLFEPGADMRPLRPDEAEANARLIAAAPELYEALEEIAKGQGAFSRDPLTHAENTIDDMKGIALAALAKARGETP